MMRSDIVDPAMQPGHLDGARTVLARTLRATRASPADVPQLRERCVERAGIGHLLNDIAVIVIVGDGGQPPHTDVNADP
jgi:hypothetical protein